MTEKYCLDNDKGRTALSLAAEEGRILDVKSLLQATTTDPDAKDVSGRTPLWWASANGHVKIVQLLLDTGKVNADSKDLSGRTPLYRAAQNGHEEVLQLLLSINRIGVDFKDEDGRSPLWWAVVNGHAAITEALLDVDNLDANPEGNCLSLFLWWESEYEIDGFSSITRLRRTPLSLAAENGQDQIVKLLLDSGKVKVNLQDTPCGQTPLCWAVRGGNEVVVSLLLGTEEIKPDLKDKLGQTPLCLAAKSGQLQIAKQLLNASNVDPDSEDERGRTPLLYGAQNGHNKIVQVLLDTSKVNVDQKDKVSGQTPLSWAARSGHDIIVKTLLDHGKSDPDSKDEHGMTPLLWALQEGHQTVAQQLCSTHKVNIYSNADAGLEIMHRFLSRWLKACEEQHNEQCHPSPVSIRLPHQIPDWVIDTSDACIVPGDAVSKYIALSYVWNNDGEDPQSSPPERLLLRQSNLLEFQKPGYLNETAELRLPQVVKDAIKIVRRLGERFLWVDCLCIVQDSKQTRSQVEHMNEIYSGAYFTIIAAKSSSLLDIQKHPKEMFYHPRFSRSPVKSYIEDLYRTLFDSKWATRGWTFQEQILSNRSVIFVDGNMFWECQCCVWDKYKLSPRSISGTNGSHISPVNELARRISSHSWPDFGTYIELACLYNRRELTYPQDALPAFCGILNSFARTFPFGFVGGLPELFLDSALLWQPFSKATRRTAKEGGLETPNRHLPSWSWCGWKCLIDPFSLRSGLAYADHEDYQSRASSWKTEGIVQWSIMSENMQHEFMLAGPLDLQKCKSLQTRHNNELPQGWFRHEGTSYEASDGGEVVFFKHTSDSKTRFKHPVPMRYTTSPGSLSYNNWPFLTGSTERAFFRVRAFIRAQHCLQKQAGLFLSVLDLPEIKNGPAIGDVCDVLSLEDMQGRSAGVLRCMSDAIVVPGEEIELIAISRGSAICTDMESAFEERVNLCDLYQYRNGLTTVFFHRTLTDGRVECKYPFKKFSGSTCPPDAENELLDTANNSKEPGLKATEDGNGTSECHYYNVLWIERDGNIAYRKAAGRVPKDIWEQNCSPAAKIILG